MTTGEVLDAAWLSVRVAGAGTLLAAAVAVPLAWLNRKKRGFFGDFLVLLPLALPPTVVGWALVLLLGRAGLAGLFGDGWLFTTRAAVLAAGLAALPLVYLPTRAAFGAVPAGLLDAARIDGAGRLGTAWHVALPLARRGLAAGLALGLARALGEFGATLMVLGLQPGRTTLPLLVYRQAERGEVWSAAWPAAALAGLTLALVAVHAQATR